MSDSTDAAIAAAEIAASAQYAAAVQVANTSYQATVVAANTQSQAQVQIAQIRATADEAVATIAASNQVQVAQIDSSWHAGVATTQANASTQVATTQANAAISAAQIDASWHANVATIQGDADKSVAITHATATTTAAETQANATIQAATIDAGWHANVASIQATASENVAQIAASNQVQVATIGASYQVQVAEIQTSNQVTVANIDSVARTTVATTQANATVTTANIDATSREQVAVTQAAASNYQADQSVAVANITQTGENFRLNTTLTFADNIFNQVFPLVEGAVGSTTGGSGGGAGFFAPPGPGGSVNSPRMGFGGRAPEISADDTYTFGTYSSRRIGGNLPRAGWGGGDIPAQGIGFGSSTTPTTPDAVAATNLPFITTSGVLTPSQIQQLVNAAVAKADQRAASEIRKLTGDMAGRGFSVNSPIMSALAVGINGQALQAQMAAASQIRVDSAKANSEAILAGQKAVSDQFIQQEGVINDGAKNEVQRVVGVLSAVCSMVGGIA